MNSSALQRLFRSLFDRPYLLLVLTTLMWAGNAVAARLAAGNISPMAMTFGRWFAVSLMIGFLLRRPFQESLPQLRLHWRRLALMGGLGFTCFNALMYVAAHSTTALNIALMQGAMPAMVLVGGLMAFGARISSLQVLGVVVTLAGVALTASHGEISRLLELELKLGDVVMLGACMLYAGYTVSLRSRPQMPALGFFSGMALAAFLTSVPLVLIEAAAGGFHLTVNGLLILIFVAIGPSFLSQMTFMRGVELIGPGRAGVFTNLTPVFGALMAVLILGEPFGWHHGAALGLVLGGIAIAEQGKR